MNVLIVDDSALMRAVLKDFFERSGVTILGEAANGKIAVEMNERLKPDLITMDIDMPVMNGLEALNAIMKSRPVPVVVFSAEITEEITQSALRMGAAEVIQKPEIDRFYDATFTTTLIGRFNAAAAMHRRGGEPRIPVTPRNGASPEKDRSADEPIPLPGEVQAVVLGASTGGPVAVKTILAALPADFPVGIAVVQHIEPRFAEGYARWLDGESPLTVTSARECDRFRAGTVIVAPGDQHLVVSGGALRLDDGPKVGSHRPSVDRLFETAADDFGRHVLGVLLTGMGRDGAAGCVRIREKGGYTIVQDEATSFIYGMPQAAAQLGGASEIRPLQEIAARMMEAVRRG